MGGALTRRVALGALASGLVAGSALAQVAGPEVGQPSSATLGLSDPTNALGLGAQAIVRGVVYLDLVNGLTFGVGQLQATQIANYTALNNAISVAVANDYYIRGWNGDLEIYGANGMVVFPTNFWYHFDGGDPQTCVLHQALGTAPIATIGDMTGAQNTASSTFRGIWLQYTNSAAASLTTTSIALNIGNAEFTIIDEVHIGQGFGGGGTLTNPPYGGLNFGASSNQFFSCTVSNIEVQGVSGYGLFNSNGGTQNFYYNIYFSNGGGGSFFYNGVSTNKVIDISSASTSQYGDSWNAVAIEWFGSNAFWIFHIHTGVVVNGLRFEGCHMTGAGASFCFGTNASVVVNGMEMLNCRILSAGPDSVSGTCPLFGTFAGSSWVVNNLAMQATTGSLITANWQLHNETGGIPTYLPVVRINSMSFLSVITTTVFKWDANMSTANFPYPTNTGTLTKVLMYELGYLFSNVAGAEIAMPAATNVTIYGQYSKPFIYYPAIITATTTVTLSNKMVPSGTGSSAFVPTGALAIVQRQAGSADGFNLLVKDGGSGTTLSTISAAATTVLYQFDTSSAGAWAIVT